MRLRLLGKTQSVAFFSPPEVHQSTLDLREAANASIIVNLDSFDVIRWLLDQSCNGIEQLESLWKIPIFWIMKALATLTWASCSLRRCRHSDSFTSQSTTSAGKLSRHPPLRRASGLTSVRSYSVERAFKTGVLRFTRQLWKKSSKSARWNLSSKLFARCSRLSALRL